MMFPLDCEMVAAARERAWEHAREQHHHLSQLPRQPHFWRRRTGSTVVLVGAWLMKWGEGLAALEHRQGAAVKRMYSSPRSGGYHV